MAIVGIYPQGQVERRARLFGALSQAFPTVRFEAREAGAWTGLDALIEFGGDSEAGAAATAGTRALAMLGPEGEADQALDVFFADAPGLDRRLRGQALTQAHLGRQVRTAAGGGQLLASVNGRPLWTRLGRLDVAALAPLELSAGEPLRNRLGRERSLALLPLLELLREVTAAERWQPPPPRATFLVDDPNLHWPSYGYLKLPALAAHAAEHGYHLSLAMVPLDAWFAHPAAASLLRAERSLSLIVHGNDHLGGELGNVREEAAALALAAQAQRRIAAFEQRTAIPVSGVMVPPHEACSQAMTRALARAGFRAITMTRPYRWLAPPSLHWLTAPAEVGALAGWRPADLAPGNLPVLLRHPFADEDCSNAELVLRAYLDQPLILYGHHADLAGGLGVLARRTAEVNRLGVAWASLGEIAETNYESRVEGQLLRIRPHSRRIAVEVPEGVTEAVVEPAPGSEPGELVATPAGSVAAGEPFSVEGAGALSLALEARDAVAPDTVPAPRRRLWPFARRLLAEGRDRAAPAIRPSGRRR